MRTMDQCTPSGSTPARPSAPSILPNAFSREFLVDVRGQDESLTASEAEFAGQPRWRVVRGPWSFFRARGELDAGRGELSRGCVYFAARRGQFSMPRGDISRAQKHFSSAAVDLSTLHGDVSRAAGELLAGRKQFSTRRGGSPRRGAKLPGAMPAS